MTPAKLLAFTLLAFVGAPATAVTVGELAPDFTASDSNGKQHSLSDFKDKTVVLEWTNHGCPYVQKHYNSGTMQDLQKDATSDGVVWLSVISSKPGAQGHVSSEQANELTRSRDAAPTAVLLDESGKVGKMYDARTTPHMYIVNETGTLVYQGGIDDRPSAALSSLDGATPYVRNALASMKAGEPIEDTATRPYGCSVKY